MTDEERRQELREQILARRKEILQAMEQERGSRVITLMHRRELWEDEPKPGGLALAAEMIATAVRLHPGKVTAIVPFYAMSGGTLIALAADEIVMEPYSVQRFILWLLADKLPQQAAAQTAEFLTGGYLSHDTPIMFDAARTLGLPAVASVPQQVYELFETCAFGPSKRPCLAVYDTAAAPSEP